MRKVGDKECLNYTLNGMCKFTRTLYAEGTVYISRCEVIPERGCGSRRNGVWLVCALNDDGEGGGLRGHY